jgi:hypothetical protein
LERLSEVEVSAFEEEIIGAVEAAASVEIVITLRADRWVPAHSQRFRMRKARVVNAKGQSC